MIWYQRSVDTMIGLPSDVVLAAAWNIIMANELGLKPGKLVFMLGDTHIYDSHFPLVQEYLDMTIFIPDVCPAYTYEGDIQSFNNESIELLGYEPYGPMNFRLHV